MASQLTVATQGIKALVSLADFPADSQGRRRTAWAPGNVPGIPQTGGSVANDWALNEEAIRNFGYMQLKKTHDAAMVIIERVYGERPRFNYFFGASQGGREG